MTAGGAGFSLQRRLQPPHDSNDTSSRGLKSPAPEGHPEAKACSTLVIVQHDIRLKLDEAYGRLRCTRTLRQGDNVLSFFE